MMVSTNVAENAEIMRKSCIIFHYFLKHQIIHGNALFFAFSTHFNALYWNNVPLVNNTLKTNGLQCIIKNYAQVTDNALNFNGL